MLHAINGQTHRNVMISSGRRRPLERKQRGLRNFGLCRILLLLLGFAALALHALHTRLFEQWFAAKDTSSPPYHSTRWWLRHSSELSARSGAYDSTQRHPGPTLFRHPLAGSTSRRANLAIALADGYTGVQLTPLLRSFRERVAGSDAILVLLVQSEPVGLRQGLVDGESVALQFFDESALPLRWQRETPHAMRYFLYARYLRALGRNTNFQRVLWADSRDVIFQANPFHVVGDRDRACFFEEHHGKTLRSERTNMHWVRDMYGERMLRDLGHKRISCSGFSVGGVHSMATYLSMMLQGLQSAPAFGEKLHEQHLLGYDQGVHNIIVHATMLDTDIEYELFNFTHGPVFHGNAVEEGMYTLDAAGDVCDLRGNKYAVVHQYDHVPALKGRLLAHWGSDKLK